MSKSNAPLLPWQSLDPELDQAVFKLIQTRAAPVSRTHKKLTEKEKSALQQEFKNAGQARTSGGKLLRAIGTAIGVEDVHRSTMLAPLKNWDRSLEKKQAGRSTHDIGRGRLYIGPTTRYIKATKLFNTINKNGSIPNISIKGVSIIPDSVRDYLATPRESGFAGMINFDCEIDLGKSRMGHFEAQIMPRGYEEVDKHSHRIFELIRIIQEDVPAAYQSEADQRIVDALIKSNQALYVEHGIRTGFIAVRQDNWRMRLSDDDVKEAHDILDRIRSTIEALPGRNNLKWRTETAAAMTYAKTSIVNVANTPSNYKVPTLEKAAKPQ